MTRTQSELITGTFTAPNRITVSSWLNDWLWEYKKPMLKPNTLASYEQNIRVHILPAIGGMFLKDVRPEHLQKFFNRKTESGLSSETVKKLKTLFPELFHRLRKTAWCKGIPAMLPLSPASPVRISVY